MISLNNLNKLAYENYLGLKKKTQLEDINPLTDFDY